MQGRLSLFENDKGNNDKRPDFRGIGEIDGQPVKIAFWWTEPKNGGPKYLSGRLEDDVPRNGEPQKPRYGGKPQDAKKPGPSPKTAAPTAQQQSAGQVVDVNAEDVADDQIPF